MKKFQLSVLLLITFISLNSCTPSTDNLVIATAANTQFALQKISQDFSKETGIAVDLVISSSGKHTAQILAGAPYDIFISADMKYPDKLFRANLTTQEPEIYAYGQLVIWAMDSTNLHSITQLNQANLSHIALPNPETAPYGHAAMEALEKLDLWASLQPRLVFSESVAQTNQYIISGAAETGFTALSIVHASENKDIGYWLAIADSLHSPIAQGIVVLKSSTKRAQADKFYQYLFSEKASSTLQSFGYHVNK